ncbi:Serine aminopeptidase, S33, partial [Dillenia turbinata]
RLLILIHSFFLWFLLLLHRNRSVSSASSSSVPLAPKKAWKPNSVMRMEEEDTLRRRALAEAFEMISEENENGESVCEWNTSLFFGARRNALFCRSWFPSSADIKCAWVRSWANLLFEGPHLDYMRIEEEIVKVDFIFSLPPMVLPFYDFGLRVVFVFRGIMIIIHGLNEHRLNLSSSILTLSSSPPLTVVDMLTSQYGVYAMDWIGHGGSDGLHGYVPSLDRVVADTGAFLEKVRSENPGTPCFLFGHSTGGAVVLKPHIKQMLEGIVLTSPALRVKPAHPIVGAVAPLFSIVAPRFQFKGANKRGIPVSRDPAALQAKYSDPLVYTGPIRVRTGHEILRITSFFTRNFKSVTVPFFILHGTADRVTDPLASQELFNEAASEVKVIKLYEGYLHDLLFEPERDEVGQDIIDWMEKKLHASPKSFILNETGCRKIWPAKLFHVTLVLGGSIKGIKR